MDPSIAKAVEASAKASDKALTIIHDTGAYLREVTGNLPKNALGLLGADWLEQKRIRNLDAMRRRTEEIFRERNAEPVDQLSPNIATELLSAAQEESRSELIELWARLLANALDPKLNSVRHSDIDAVRKMDSMDVLVLDYLRVSNFQRVRNGSGSNETCKDIIEMALVLDVNADAILVSVEHLTRIGIFVDLSTHWQFTATGRELLRGCYPETARSA